MTFKSKEDAAAVYEALRKHLPAVTDRATSHGRFVDAFVEVAEEARRERDAEAQSLYDEILRRAGKKR